MCVEESEPLHLTNDFKRYDDQEVNDETFIDVMNKFPIIEERLGAYTEEKLKRFISMNRLMRN